MGYYTANGGIAAAATKTPLVLGATAATRFRIQGYSMSTTGTPTSDQGVEMRIARCTALGTSTAFTPLPNDPADPASVFTAGQNCSAEPTYTAGGSLQDRAFNPRATVQWAAYDPRAELIAPATAANGIGFQIIGSGGAAGNVQVDVQVMQ